MPQGLGHPASGASGGAPGASPTNPIPAASPGITVNPAIRNLEK
jgi:hypothetical protein